MGLDEPEIFDTVFPGYCGFHAGVVSLFGDLDELLQVETGVFVLDSEQKRVGDRMKDCVMISLSLPIPSIVKVQ